MNAGERKARDGVRRAGWDGTRYLTMMWYRPPNPLRARQAKSPLAVLRSTFGPLLKEFWISRQALIIPAFAYVGGLLVWSVNATRNDLGPQVAASLQYLAAGVIPAVLILIGVALSVVWIATPAWTSNRVTTQNPQWAEWLKRIATVGLMSTALLWIGQSVSIVALEVYLPTWILYVVVAVSTVSFFVLVCLVEPRSLTTSILPLIYGVGGIFVLVAVAIGFYMNRAYPWLPQSVGGGRARCAVLDIQTKLVSPETLKLLNPQSQGATLLRQSEDIGYRETVQTRKVDILFARDNVLFIRPKDALPAESRTVELRGDVVRAVVACD